MRFVSPKPILLAAVLLYAGLAFWIAWNNAPGADEGWFASPAYNLLHNGHMGTSILDPRGYILRPELTGLEHHTYWVLPGHLVLQALWYKITGFSLLSMRALSIGWGITVLLCTFSIAKHLTQDSPAATLATGLMATDLLLTQYGASGRMDMMSLGLGLAAQAIYLSHRHVSPARALFFSHLCIAWAGLTHPNAIFPGACLLLLMAYDLWARPPLGWRFRPLHLGFILLPYLLTGAAYALYIAQDPVSFQAQIAANNVGGGRTYYLLHPAQAITEEIARYRTYYGLTGDANPSAWLKSLSLFGLLAGFLALCLRRTHVLLIALTLLPLTGLTFFNFKNAYYLIYAIPYLAVSAAVFYLHLWRSGGWTRWATVALLAAMTAINLAGTIKRGFQMRTLAQEYAQIQTIVTPLLSQGKIMASPQFAFVFGLDRTIQDDTMGFFTGKRWDVMVEYRFTDVELANITQQAPAVAAHRQKLLKESFTEIFRGPTTSVYRRL
jgi:hypothetical protein